MPLCLPRSHSQLSGQGHAAAPRPRPDRHQPRCLFFQVFNAGLPMKARGLRYSTRQALLPGPGTHPHESRLAQPCGREGPGFLLAQCCTRGSCTTAAFQVQVNMTFLKYPNWQLGIIRHEEEDTIPRTCLEPTRRCGPSERSQTCCPGVFILPQTTLGPGKPGPLPQYDQFFYGGKKRCLAFLSKAPCLCTHFSCDFSHSSSSRMAENKQGLLSRAPASSGAHTLLRKSASETERRRTHSIDLL